MVHMRKVRELAVLFHQMILKIFSNGPYLIVSMTHLDKSPKTVKTHGINENVCMVSFQNNFTCKYV